MRVLYLQTPARPSQQEVNLLRRIYSQYRSIGIDQKGADYDSTEARNELGCQLDNYAWIASDFRRRNRYFSCRPRLRAAAARLPSLCSKEKGRTFGSRTATPNCRSALRKHRRNARHSATSRLGPFSQTEHLGVALGAEGVTSRSGSARNSG